jgi:general secretion pathway protein A
MYTAFYELKQEPFHVTPDPEFLFPSPSHKEALAAIIYGIEQRKGFVAITGEVGVGKTTILRSYLDFADRKDLKLVYVYNSEVTFDELVTTLLQELGIPERPPSTFMAVTRLHEELIEIYRKNQTVVLIIDEAQNMPVETLESLRMLSNLETVTEKLIQIMLIGQPEFDEMLQQHRLRQLRQRIAIHARIGALNFEDSIAYLEHRLAKVALSTKPVFTKNALRLLAEAAEGIPRNLNIMSDNALITGFGYQARPVNAKIVKEVLADRQIGVPAAPVRAERRPGLWIGAGAAAAAVALGVFVLLRAGTSDRPDKPVAQSAAPGAESDPLDQTIARFGSWVDGVLHSGASPPAGTTGNQAPRDAAPARQENTRSGSEPRLAESAPPVRNPLPEAQPRVEQPRAPLPAPPPPAPPPQVSSSPAAPAAPTPPPVRPVETARADPAPQPAPVAPVTSSPAPALVPPPPVEPAPPARSDAVESPARAAATPTPPAPTAAPRRSQPIPLAAPTPPPATRPAPPPTAQRPTPSISAPPAAAPSPPVVYSLAVPSVVPPSASGSGAAASGAGSEFVTRRIPAPSAARSEQLTRTVRSGDSLWTMAEDVYGYVNPNVLRRVQDANPHIRNINLLAPGQEVVFPRVPEAPSDAGLALYGSLPTTGGN